MRRGFMILFLIILAVVIINMRWNITDAAHTTSKVTIPDQAIRLRILANSNSDVDQKVKREVRDAVNAEIAPWVKDLKKFKQARRVIRRHLPDIRKTVAKTLQEHHVRPTFKVKLRKNVQFPTKIYGDYVYPAGQYEALLITLGKGEGANWWCVLFPPLCFLDFQNGDAIKADAANHASTVSKQAKENNTHIHIRFLIVDWLQSLSSVITHIF